MESFKDKAGNVYYMEKDTLKVKLVHRDTTRVIGKVTYNMKTNKASLTIHRNPDEKHWLGFLISYEPLKQLEPDRLYLVEHHGRDEKLYYINWSELFFDIDNPWKITPNNGYEEQMIIPDPYWNEIRGLSSTDIKVSR